MRKYSQTAAEVFNADASEDEEIQPNAAEVIQRQDASEDEKYRRNRRHNPHLIKIKDNPHQV
jgi:hypothetical protein